MHDSWLDPWLDSWLDLVHGSACVACPQPGRSLCTRCAAELPVCGKAVRPTPCPAGLAACFAAGDYDDVLRAMILAHKEHGTFSLAAPLGRALAAAVGPATGRAPGAFVRAPRDPAGLTVLVPVPSRAGVVRMRGHDPVLRIARAAVRELRRSGHRVRVDQVLEQRGAVEDQAGLTATQRSANLSGSMSVRPRARAALARSDRPVSLLLCDDVLTTGATAREAQRALEETGLRVRAVVTVAATRRRFLPHLGGPGAALSLSGHAD